MDEVKLLPCAHCGSADVRFDQIEFQIVCRNRDCSAYPHMFDTKTEAIAAWNTRPPIGVREAAEPWADYHGDLPDYDHPLRPVFESGVQYAVELLAKMLHVEDWEICDGTEEFDGDLGGTLLNIVIKTWPADEHGDWIDFRDPKNRIAAMPAIDQDGGE